MDLLVLLALLLVGVRTTPQKCKMLFMLYMQVLCSERIVLSSARKALQESLVTIGVSKVVFVGFHSALFLASLHGLHIVLNARTRYHRPRQGQNY